MIGRFGADTALLMIDAQVGVDELAYWGGPTGRRNNPDAEKQQRRLLDGFWAASLPVAFTLHDSWEAQSPLKLALPTGAPLPGLEPHDGELVVVKHVNGGFFGTDLEIRLRRAGVSRIVAAGYFTNFCVETTVRSAGNLGFDTYLCADACSTSNRIGPDGVDHDPELVHQLSIATLHGEFCTAISTDDALDLVQRDRDDLDRAMGNE